MSLIKNASRTITSLKSQHEDFYFMSLSVSVSFEGLVLSLSVCSYCICIVNNVLFIRTIYNGAGLGGNIRGEIKPSYSLRR